MLKATIPSLGKHYAIISGIMLSICTVDMLNVIMLSVIMVSVILINVIMLCIIIPSVIMLNLWLQMGLSSSFNWK